MDTLWIPCESDSFPPGSLPSRTNDLEVTWNDILWAAVTVGRPNRHYVFRHGDASMYEAIFRWSLVRMALEQSGPGGYRLRRTPAAQTLDPTEKGAVNYFLGMTFCKLFAAKLLNTPWLLHLDVFRPQLNAALTGRSRPDLVGWEHRTNKWHAFECKGRTSPPDQSVKQKAKEQAHRLTSVNGTRCSLHIGAITYFRDDVLQFYWRDPEPEEGRQIDVPFTPQAWRYCYAPLVALIAGNADYRAMMRRDVAFLPIENLDMKISIHPAVAKPAFEQQWDMAHSAAVEAEREIALDDYHQDGLAVRAGDSWRSPFKE